MPTTPPTSARSSLSPIPFLGAGAILAGIAGFYLYRRPRLRSRLRNAGTVREAASLVARQVRSDGMDAADNVMHAVSSGMSTGLQRTRAALGRRFPGSTRAARRGSPAKVAARHVKNEAKHLARTAKADMRHAAEHGRIEAEHLMDEMKEARDLSANRAANM